MQQQSIHILNGTKRDDGIPSSLFFTGGTSPLSHRFSPQPVTQVSIFYKVYSHFVENLSNPIPICLIAQMIAIVV
jgi:hypothetical protein